MGNLLLLVAFCFSFFLTLLHVLAVLSDRHRLDFLAREHEVYTFKFHHDLDIVAVERMNIAVDALLLLKDGIVSGDKEQKSEANQPY